MTEALPVHNVDPALLEHLTPAGDVKKYPQNARVHDLPALAHSLKVNGQFRPLIANRRTGHIIKGNGTFTAATEHLGWTHLAVTWVDVDADTERRMVLVDNRTSELGWFDDGALVNLLGNLDDLDGTGYTDSDLSALNDSLAGDLLPPSPPVPGDTIKEAKKKFDLSDMRTLVLVTEPMQHDRLLADLDLLREEGESTADLLLRLVREAPAA